MPPAKADDRLDALEDRMGSLERKSAARASVENLIRIVVIPLSLACGAAVIGHEVRLGTADEKFQTRRESHDMYDLLNELLHKMDARLIRIEEAVKEK